MARYLLVKGGFLAQVVIADATFASAIAGNYDAVIDAATLSAEPPLGWIYDSVTHVFSAPPATPASTAKAIEATIAVRKEYCDDLMDRFKRANILAGINGAQGLWMHHRLRAVDITFGGNPYTLDILNMVVSGDIELGCLALMSATPDDMSQTYHWLSTTRLAWLVSEMKSFLGWP